MLLKRAAAFLLLLAALPAIAQKPKGPHVLMISIDGMKPEYVTKADEHGLKVPNLRTFLTEGTYAEGVQGVIPTVTYPSHTTLVTGVWPAEHGIWDNTVFDPLGVHKGEWYWYFSALKVETLYTAAKKAGLSTGAVGWPVTVGAPIDYLIAEFGQSEKTKVPVGELNHPVDIKEKLGVKTTEDEDGDVKKTAWSVAIIGQYKPNLMLVHLTNLDHQEHQHGPFSAEANKTIETLDGQVGEIVAAERKMDPKAKIVIVSDHGFVQVDKKVRVNALLAKEGLMTIAPNDNGKGFHVVTWDATAWDAGGMTAIVLRDPGNKEVYEKTKALLDKMAADPQYGINRIVPKSEIEAKGGFPSASFAIDFKPGYATASGVSGRIVVDTPGVGTHGYMPDHPELRSTFMTAGAGIAKGRDLGVIDMRQIAPTVAEMLGIQLSAAKQPPVHYQP